MMKSETRLLLCLALSTGVLSGVWAWLAEQFVLMSWIGFLGCTTYFAIPSKGLAGLCRGMAANISGASWAAIAIALTTSTGFSYAAVITGAISFMMCVQSRLRTLCFVPGSFIGACALFGSQSGWLSVVLTLCLGGIFGFLMQSSGTWMANRWSSVYN
ncbi:DUF1097 domain-containing protein [Hafnia paralvei]|uniref:DUF1097 domain-containing protein n=1 Tax=Hafnia paralvei TaxID=546367 RepID=UPI0018F08948|nr:DUF1097 domain-containing protein [Hafnia paralvei]MBW2959936.1 DUF1097 domain-containing protein [Hafnia paralvei]MCQ4170937.1 DUF1097 domain-containing protein [Hafnia paralvei]